MAAAAIWEEIPRELLLDTADFDQAIRVWSAWVGRPLGWNEWQIGVSKIRPLFVDSAPPRGPDYKAAIASLRDEVMEEIHGPMWKQAVLPPSQRVLDTAPAAPEGTLLAVGGEGGPVAPETGFLPLPPAGGARSLPAVSVAGSDGGRPASVRSMPAVMTPQAARTLFAPGGPAAAGAPQEARGPLPPPAMPMLLSEQAARVMEDHGAEASETSSDCMARTRDMVAAMRAAGVSEDEKDLAVSIELYAKDLVGLWQQEAAATGATDGVRAWALQVLTVQDFADAQTQYEVESQVRALAMLAGLDYAQASRQVERVWATTPAGSAAHKRPSGPSYPSPGESAGIGPSQFSTPLGGSTPPPLFPMEGW